MSQTPPRSRPECRTPRLVQRGAARRHTRRSRRRERPERTSVFHVRPGHLSARGRVQEGEPGDDRVRPAAQQVEACGSHRRGLSGFPSIFPSITTIVSAPMIDPFPDTPCPPQPPSEGRALGVFRETESEGSNTSSMSQGMKVGRHADLSATGGVFGVSGRRESGFLCDHGGILIKKATPQYRLFDCGTFFLYSITGTSP